MLTDRATMAGQYGDAANLNARIALHERFSTNRSDLQRWLFDQIALPDSALVLELGRGPGTLWIKNLDRLPPGWAVLLTDASPGMVRQAAGGLAGDRRPFGFAVADARTTPCEDGSVDAVARFICLSKNAARRSSHRLTLVPIPRCGQDFAVNRRVFRS